MSRSPSRGIAHRRTSRSGLAATQSYGKVVGRLRKGETNSAPKRSMGNAGCSRPGNCYPRPRAGAERNGTRPAAVALWGQGTRGSGGFREVFEPRQGDSVPTRRPRGPAPREGVQKGPMVPKAARYPFKALTAQSEFEVPDGCRSIKRGASPAGRRCWERAKVVRGSHRPSLRWQAGVGHGPRNSLSPGWARCRGAGRRQRCGVGRWDNAGRRWVAHFTASASAFSSRPSISDRR